MEIIAPTGQVFCCCEVKKFKRIETGTEPFYFPEEMESTLYMPGSGELGQVSIDRITSMALNVTFPDDTFELSFPPDVRVYDEAMEEWIDPKLIGQSLEQLIRNAPMQERVSSGTNQVKTPTEADSSALPKGTIVTPSAPYPSGDFLNWRLCVGVICILLAVVCGFMILYRKRKVK